LKTAALEGHADVADMLLRKGKANVYAVKYILARTKLNAKNLYLIGNFLKIDMRNDKKN
jgi:hypothetical protein